MDLNNYITFGGISSATYGIYIDGSGTFNSPERDVTMITIPGRNGTLALDNGRFENVEVTYRAFVSEDNGKTMSANIQDFRNAIGALKGYQSLVDTYHTDEYRLATFRNGLEVSPVIYQTGGEFEITFDCKPQRFLTSGETAVSVANNGTITNPTKFDAEPLLEFKGYGNIGINGETITIDNGPPGLIKLLNTVTTNAENSYTLDSNKYVTGDTITIASGSKLRIAFNGNAGVKLNSYSYTDGGVPNFAVGDTYTSGIKSGFWVDMTFGAMSFVAGTTSSHYFDPLISTVSYTYNGTTYTNNIQIEVYFTYNGGTNTLTFASMISGVNYSYFSLNKSSTLKEVKVDSTKTITSTIYVDLDIAEAYTYDNGSLIGLNNIVSIPSIPPVLPSGNTTVTYDNTITNFKITPRWWRL